MYAVGRNPSHLFSEFSKVRCMALVSPDTSARLRSRKVGNLSHDSRPGEPLQEKNFLASSRKDPRNRCSKSAWGFSAETSRKAFSAA